MSKPSQLIEAATHVTNVTSKRSMMHACVVVCVLSTMPLLHAQSTQFTLPNIYAVPEAPAFALLGTNTSSLLGRGSTRDLALNLGTITDGAHVPLGSAVEWAPLRMWLLREWSLRDYQQRALARAVMNSRLSLGTRADSTAGGTVLSIGWRCTLLDDSDLRLDTAFVARSMRLLEGMHEYSMAAVREANRQREVAGRNGLSEVEKDSALKRANNEYKKLKLAEWTALRDAEAPKRWNRTRVDVAVAERYRSSSTLWTDLRVDCAAAWLNGQWALDDGSSAIECGVYSALHRSALHGTMDSLSVNAALRFSYGNNARNIYINVDVSHSSFNGKIAQQCNLSLGTKVRLGTGIWLDATLGAAFQRGSKPSIIFSISPRFGTSDEDFIGVDEAT